MRIKLSLLLAALILPLLQAQASAPVPTVRPAIVAVADETPTDRVIIKYKASADLSGSKAPAHADRMGTLSAAAGVQLEYLREMSGDAHVLSLPDKLPLSEVRAIAARLTQLSDVEYAQPDYVLQPMGTTPNDPMYSQQWHYYDTWGINAPAAWDITTGSTSIVVAVIDTGITDHADLSGRTVPGYDFISDIWTANDGNGRDSDPSDPGDWTALNDCYSGWPGSNSSWHGTHVAGTIGAASNNGQGVAGINWVSKILPVRVLGKCGGYTSDIVDGMRWAAGLSVSGVTDNANPAKVENMSLGGYSSSPPYCDTAMQSAVNDVVAAGATVVVAAGNSNDDASHYSPASCNGVITVAATDQNGNRSIWNLANNAASNYGSVVEISAPGTSVLSTLNTGTQGPVADTYQFYNGTSMATPHVAGVASLVLSLNPTLTPNQVLQILQSTALTFTIGSTCNTSICGRGIVDAGAAVRSVACDVSIQKQVVGSDLKPGDRVTFTLSIANQGGMVATGVVVTDSVPSQVLSPTFASNIAITRTGVLTYVWNVGTLGVGQSGVITIYGRIDPSLPSDLSFTNSASISAQQDYVSSNNTSSATVGGSKLFLPIVMKRWPPIPDTPVLNAVGSSGGGNYTVSWNAAYLADTYTLQEDDNSSFSSPTTVYGPGASLSWNASSKPVGTYYYRVKATNSYGDSGWSNVQSVTVSPQQSGPTPGFWKNSGAGGEEFTVSTDRAYVNNFAVYVTVSGCGDYKITHTESEPISNNQFSFSGSFYASGTFNSSTTASGSDGLDHLYISGCGTVSSSGSWSWNATWQYSDQVAFMPAHVVGPATAEPANATDNSYVVTPIR